ncbi:unnamed protein product [Echinostoma caproni]|uniref:Ras-GAP domain-containing protein n=1 Tax=Echinostoma caproni TaxID=27848 RepID=A0A183A4W1_9TREM|nr:unnamed protein product [Echinostoma caproni]
MSFFRNTAVHGLSHFIVVGYATIETPSPATVRLDFAFVTIPLKEVPQKAEIQQWLHMQSPSLIQLDQWQNGSTANSSPNAPRFRKRSTPIACFRHSTSASAFSILNETVEESPTGDGKSNTPVPAISRGRKKTWTAGVVPAEKELSRESRSTGSASAHGTTISAMKGGLDGTCNSPVYGTGAFVLPDSGPMPQIRVNLQYEAMDVLPIDYYGELREFVKTHSLALVRFLEPQLAAKQKEELASCLVNIYERIPGLSVAQLLTDLLREDLRQHNDESMIFRSNSAGTKAVECYIKLVGNDYLQHILKSSIDQLLATSEDFEIDPSRITSTESNGTINPANVTNQVDKNREALIRHLKVIWSKISSSVSDLPRELREVFASLSTSVEQSHGSRTAARLISSCLFLRFICPAIHGPVLFGLATAVPESSRLSRNLTMVAKVLQNLANLATFEEKERHMRSLNTFVEAEIPRMCAFLQSISTEPTDEDAPTQMSGCHQFIDLGYEFAKLTSLLLAYTGNSTLPDELADLPSILCFINEHTHDAFLSSWTPDVIPCRRYASCDSSGPLLTNRPRFNSTDSVPYVPTSTSQTGRDGFSNYSSTNSLVPKLDDSGTGSQSVFLNGHGTHSYTSAVQRQSTAPTSRHGSTSGNTSDTFYVPEPTEEEEEENTEDLMVQYQEQLRQLNACIDRVESNEICPRAITSHPHIMRVNGLGTSSQITSRLPDPKSHAAQIGPPSIPGNCGSNTNRTVPYTVRPTGTDELNCISDYESGDLTERSDEPCHSEPMNTPSRAIDSDAGKQPFLAGSPSLDQLAERLQELRLLLKHERQELEQVVATKTQAIQQQEQSIEQLASELDQLRRGPGAQSGRGRVTNGRKWTSGTVSPSSSCSLSSDCHTSNQSDGAYLYSDELSALPNDAGQFASDSVRIPGTNSAAPAGAAIGNGGGGNHRLQRFRAKAWSDRTEQSNLTPTNTSNTEAMNRYGPNLLDLTRASEGTGIPLGTGHQANDNAFTVIFKVPANPAKAVRQRHLATAEAVAIRLLNRSLWSRKMIRPVTLFSLVMIEGRRPEMKQLTLSTDYEHLRTTKQ